MVTHSWVVNGRGEVLECEIEGCDSEIEDGLDGRMDGLRVK